MLPGADGSGDGFRYFAGNPNSVRPQTDTFNMQVESQRVTHGSFAKANHIGRLNVIAQEGAEERRQSSIIHGGFQGSETLTLALQDFDSGNFKDLDVNYGKINALIPSGQHLMVFQSSKVSRIPINRSIIATAGGDNNLAVSNTVMGAEMSFEGDYGVDTNITACRKVDGAVYFIDKGRQAIIRIAQDGFSPISDVDISEKINKTFLDSISSTRNYAIGYDKDTQEVLFTFIADGDFTGETYAYNHQKSVWTTRYSFVPLAYVEGVNEVLSAKFARSTILHLHNNDNERCKFYGTSNKSSVTMISTAKQPSMVKTYNAIGLESNATADVTISNSRNQSVSVAHSEFNTKEDRFYKEIPFDGSNLQEARKTEGLSVTDQTWKGHLVPLGVVDNISNDRFELESKVPLPIPEEQNVTLVYYQPSVSAWASIMSPYIIGSTADFTDGFVEAAQITGSGTTDGGKTYIEAANFFGTYDIHIPGYGTPVGKMLGYIVTTPADVSDTTYSGTTINQPYGGKKLRDYYAEIKVESRANDADFELYTVTLDVDESKLHM